MAQIGWTAHRVLLDAFADDPAIYAWYAAKAAENRCPVRHLNGQIDLRLHERQGAALTNFPAALEPTDAGRALEATKDRTSSTSWSSLRGRRRGDGPWLHT